MLHRADWPEPELSYSLTRAAWGYGFATEAARGAREWALSQPRFDRLASFILPENSRSIRVAQKLGATLDGIVTLRGFDAEWWVHRK
jgi:hypothetical protein